LSSEEVLTFEQYRAEVVASGVVLTGIRHEFEELLQELLDVDIYVDKVAFAVSCCEYKSLVAVCYDAANVFEVEATWLKDADPDVVSDPWARKFVLDDIRVREGMTWSSG
jgi:hypothetical protein